MEKVHAAYHPSYLVKFIYKTQSIMKNSLKFIVAISVRNPDEKVFFKLG